MSSLIFDFGESHVFLASDTLAVDHLGEPAFFTSKAQYVPHLRTIIAGTGYAGFSWNWATIVNNRILVSGIENLDYHTPSGLRELWSEGGYNASESDQSTTVYQLGYSSLENRMKGYAYRSANNFVSEPLEYGLRVKPHCEVIQSDSFLQDVIKMMNDQRKLEAQKSLKERVYIGGQISLFTLDAHVCSQATIFEFDDFKEHFEIALSNIPR